MRYIQLWLELMGCSFRQAPWLTFGTWVAVAVDVLSLAAYSLAIRMLVDATIVEERTTAVFAVFAAAGGFALTMVMRDLCFNLTGTLSDRVGRLDLNPRIHRMIADIPELDHLERAEYLDRVTVVRGAAGGLMRGCWGVVTTTAAMLKVTVVVVLLGSVSPWLLPLLAFALAPIWAGSRGQSLVAKTEVTSAEVYRLQQALFDLQVRADSGKELRLFGNLGRIRRMQETAWTQAVRERFRSRMSAGLLRLLGWTIFAFAFAAALAVVAYQVQQGNGTVGDFVLTVTIAATLQQNAQSVVVNAAETSGARRYVEPYFWLQDHVAAAANGAPTVTASVPARLEQGIEIVGVTYRYPDSVEPAVDDVTVLLPAGKVTAIVGEFGSGKTTLVKLLIRFHRVEEGTILVDGTDVADMDVQELRRRTTAAFQDFSRFEVPYGTGIGIGDLPHVTDEDWIRGAIAKAGADDVLASLPDGLDTQLGTDLGGVSLSEGQWQGTALARSSMREEPLLLLLDEPTAALDARSEQAIFEQYMRRSRELAQRTGAVTVIVSHRFSTVAEADQILVMRSGQIVERGTHRELINADGRYAEMFNLQAQAYLD